MTTAYGCDQCDLMIIQGIRSHEHGCPDAWQDDTHECPWCGMEFQPETRWQAFDDDSCYAAYNNLEVSDPDNWNN